MSSAAASMHHTPRATAYGALAALSLAMLLASLGTSGANVALPTLAHSFGASIQAVQWVVVAYLLAVTLLIVGAGRLGDLFGRRQLLIGGLTLFAVASLLGGLAPTLPVLIVARALQGAGAAAMMALTMTFVADVVPAERTGRSMGLLGTMSAVGTALGPSLGGLLIVTTGWRALFLVNVPLGAIAVWLVLRHIPREHAAMAADRHVEARMLPRPAAVLRNRSLAASLTANALVSCVMMSTLIVGPFYLTAGMGLTTRVMGLVMTVGPVLTALAGVPGGQLVDSRGARQTSLGGLTAMLVGSALLAALPTAFGLAAWIGGIAFLTVGYALFQSANNTAVMAHAQPGARGVVAGALSLSRNLGLIAGASLMGAVFARTASTSDMATAGTVGVVLGMQRVFLVAAVLIVIAGVLVAVRRTIAPALTVLLLTALARPAVLRAQSADAPTRATANGPYPLAAAGWGPQLGDGMFASRWAEDWSLRRALNAAPTLKALPLAKHTSITVGAELRARHDSYENARLTARNSFQQDLLRATLGADLHLTSRLRAYTEITSGQVHGRRRESTANFQNDASLQQAFLDARTNAGGALFGAMLGRQEFADGPRQLVSLSDGPNLHRTWNGVRLYAHSRRARLGVYDFRATRVARGAFDERADPGERMRGATGSIIVGTTRNVGNVYVDPFWIGSDHPATRAGGVSGLDRRHTYGVRVWARGRDYSLDVTAANQRGTHDTREVNAWGLFAVQSVAVSRSWWKPRVDLRVDIASGGSTGETGVRREFNPLYASTGYLSEGQFLALANLVMLAPGLTVSPARGTRISLEYGFARRYTTEGVVRGGGMRGYAATRGTGGHRIGGLTRLTVTHAMNPHSGVFLTLESLDVSRPLRQLHVQSGRYLQLGTTLRY